MATKVWLGGAVDIAQVDTVTIGGTWAQGDTVTLTIGSNDLTVTVGSSTATSSVASILSAAVNASSKTDNLQGDETRNVGGQQIPEFTEVTGSASGSVVTIEADTRGIPFTLSESVSSSSGTAEATTDTSSTGANHFDNADNWSTGTVPTHSDDIVFQSNEIDCLYGLDQTATSNVTLQVDASYTGNIGLPEYNDTGYDEYRESHLKIQFSNAERSIVIGEGVGGGSSRIRLRADSSSNPKVLIALTGVAAANSLGAVDIVGGGSDMEVSIRQGSLSLSANSADSTAVKKLEVTHTTQVGGDAIVFIGNNASVNELDKSGGQVTFINTKSSSTVSTLTNRAGLVEFNGAGQVTTLKIEGGELRYHSTGTVTNTTLDGSGVIDLSRDLRTKIFANPVERYSDSSRFLDPNKVVSNLQIDNNEITDLSSLAIGRNIRITRANL